MTRRDGEPQFVNDPPEKYLCVQCHHIIRNLHSVRNPVQAECGHQFCGDCNKHSDVTLVCPVCDKQVFVLTPITDIHGLLSLVVYCLYEEKGCTWTGPWRQHKDHLSSCPYRDMVTCQICRQEIPRCKQEQHIREFCYRSCPYCGKTIRTCHLKMHQFNECPQRNNVAGFGQPLRKPNLGLACECHKACCSLYAVCIGEACANGVTSIPVCVGGKGKQTLNDMEKAEEAELEKATKEVIDSHSDILALIKERLSRHTTIAKVYMSQKCPEGGDFFKECVEWYRISELKQLVHMVLDSSESILKKIDEFERKVDKFIFNRIIQCDNQVICMKVDSLFSPIPAKICNVDLLVNRVKQAVSKYTDKEFKVWFCSAHQAVNLELHDAVQCSVDVTGAVDQNKTIPDSFDSTYQHETNQSSHPLPFIASFGNDC